VKHSVFNASSWCTAIQLSQHKHCRRQSFGSAFGRLLQLCTRCGLQRLGHIAPSCVSTIPYTVEVAWPRRLKVTQGTVGHHGLFTCFLKQRTAFLQSYVRFPVWNTAFAHVTVQRVRDCAHFVQILDKCKKTPLLRHATHTRDYVSMDLLHSCLFKTPNAFYALNVRCDETAIHDIRQLYMRAVRTNNHAKQLASVILCCSSTLYFGSMIFVNPVLRLLLFPNTFLSAMPHTITINATCRLDQMRTICRITCMKRGSRSCKH
jgi:hypothetical protein